MFSTPNKLKKIYQTLTMTLRDFVINNQAFNFKLIDKHSLDFTLIRCD